MVYPEFLNSENTIILPSQTSQESLSSINSPSTVTVIDSDVSEEVQDTIVNDSAKFAIKSEPELMSNADISVDASQSENELTGTEEDIQLHPLDVEQQSFYVNWQSVSIGSGVGTRRITQRGPNLAPESGSIIGNQSISVTLLGETYWKP